MYILFLLVQMVLRCENDCIISDWCSQTGTVTKVKAMKGRNRSYAQQVTEYGRLKNWLRQRMRMNTIYKILDNATTEKIYKRQKFVFHGHGLEKCFILFWFYFIQITSTTEPEVPVAVYDLQDFAYLGKFCLRSTLHELSYCCNQSCLLEPRKMIIIS